jgi:hypothetical protein
MDRTNRDCPDCAGEFDLDRRYFLRTGAGVAAAAAAGVLPLGWTPHVEAAATPESDAEKAVKGLFETLTDEQKKVICFDWDYVETKSPRKGVAPRGLLRTHVSNNWEITEPFITKGDFYTDKQKDIIHDIFKGIINPDWYKKFIKQLKDDTEGQEWGKRQSIAIFGTPGKGKFQFVMTGRHMTIRADGGSTENVSFGGPIFYGHAASGFTEKKGHPGNVFWPQAVEANKVFGMLEAMKQEKALVVKRPRESAVDFKGPKGTFTGFPCAKLNADQQKELEKVLAMLVEPYRKEDCEEAMACLKKQGGLDKCFLSFYKEGALEEDKGIYDNWRLEGPSFVWYFRGTPHVHVWVNVASDPTIKLNARG